MIKIDKTTNEITTDCKTVGEFMTQAAAFGFDRLEIIVDGFRYEFSENPKIRVTDYTPLGSVAVERADSLLSGVTVLRVTTAPKPKTVRNSGWVNLYKVKGVKPIPVGFVYKTKEECNADASRLVNENEFLAVAKVEWEEVQE